jgi:hypothetical protein
MTNINTLRKILILWGMLLLVVSALAACQSKVETTPSVGEAQSSESAQSPQSEAQEQDPTAPQSSPESEPLAPPSSPEVTESDPAAIEAAWQSSPHANTFVVDAAGQNNSCAQCHAPFNWLPSMDTLPESCFACKFELEDPPPYIPEDRWSSIPCTVCHPVDRDDNILPEIAWLEIPVLGEYAEVASPTELCLKCHAPLDLPQHGGIDLVNAHAAYQCTDCHSFHETTATCVSEACHSDVIAPETPIPGHDADHQAVSCVACHDGGDMEVGPDEAAGQWITFATTGSADTGLDRFAFTSHNVVLVASCDRCHFVDNPWALTVDVVVP